MAQSIQVKKIGWWHERLADWMIANPDRSLGDAAAHFNCSRAWLSIVKNSDCFKIYWSTRSGDFSTTLNDRAVDTLMGIKEKTAGVTEMALEQLASRMELTGDVMPVATLLDVANLGLKSLGYQAKAASAAPTVNVNVGLVSAEDLARAREKAQAQFNLKAEVRREQAEAKAPIEVDYVEE